MCGILAAGVNGQIIFKEGGVTHVKLANQVELSFPDVLEIQSHEYQQMLREAVHDVQGESEEVESDDNEIVLQQAGLNIRTEASFRDFVRIMYSSSRSQGEALTNEKLEALGADELWAIDTLYREMCENELRAQTIFGPQRLVSWNPVQVVDFGSNKALKVSYMRQLKSNPPVNCEQYQVWVGTVMHNICISYRHKDFVKWKPVADFVLKSLIIPGVKSGEETVRKVGMGDEPTVQTDSNVNGDGNPDHARFTERQAANERMRMDYELGKFLRSPEARDPERKFAYLDDYSAKRWGVRNVHGSAWTKERTPFATADQYADAMVGMVVRGYEAISTPEYNAWMAARESGNRAEMIRLAGIDTRKVGIEQSGAKSVYSPAPMATLTDKTDEEIDGELADYNARMEGQNFVGVFRTYDAAYHFTDDEKAAIEASLAKGDGLPEEYADWYATLVHDDPNRAAVIGSMVDLARRRQSAWYRDNVVMPLMDGWKRVKSGVANLGETVRGFVFRRSMHGILNADAGRSCWNGAEHAEYAKRVEAYGKRIHFPRGPERSARENRIREEVDRMCVDRLREEAMPKAVRYREGCERWLLADALGHKQTVEYDFWGRFVAGILLSHSYRTRFGEPSRILRLHLFKQIPPRVPCLTDQNQRDGRGKRRSLSSQGHQRDEFGHIVN